MNYGRYTISSIIKNQRNECLTDRGWDSDCAKALLFAPKQAEAAIRALSEKSTSEDVKAAYIIQNEKFDYFDGEKQWVYSIADARFYESLKETEKNVAMLMESFSARI